MTNLQEATEKICELKGITMALDVMLAALVRVLPEEARTQWARSFGTASELATAMLVNADISEHSLDAFARETERWQRLLRAHAAPLPASLGDVAVPGCIRPGAAVDAAQDTAR